MTRLIIIFLEILIAVPLGLAIGKLGLGSVAWIFGGMGAGALVLESYRNLYKVSLKPNKTARKIGQACVGLAIGFSIAQSNLLGLSSKLPIFIFLTLFMLLTGSLIGYVYSHLSQTNLLNAMLATVPGGVGLMSSIAADYGRNVSLVALVQIIRVTSVILIIPLVAGAANTSNVSQATFTISDYLINTEPYHLVLLIITIILAVLGVTIAGFLQLPAASFFGTLIVGISFNYVVNLLPFTPDINFMPPQSISLIGQILLGITVGEYWGDKQTLEKHTLWYALIPVAMTIGAGFIAAGIAQSLTPWDWLTCLLVTAPGGSTEMILVALALDHNAEIVTAGHIVRLLALNISLPLWIFLFRHFDRRLASSVNG
ncbi:AbrB family transcriptional regulator [Lyngbya aestuarii]|uniref:AbrB family transcriptional regulator n=1 Tax=Lyngbya aestuarii TaxID=118322 RepID=UPI00403DB18F